MLAADPLQHLALYMTPQSKAAGALAEPAGGGGDAVSPAVPPPLDGAYTGATQVNGLPILNSLPAAPVAIYLDFDGDTGSNTAAYSEDSDATTYNASEQANLYNAWRHIVLYYSMFNVNVTTVNPSVPKAYSIVGNGAGGSTGGYAYVNTFPSTTPMAFNEAGNARTRQSGIAHEVGHVFGLSHQADFDLLGNKTAEYSSGFDSLHGPIMGVDYAQNVHKWFVGHPSSSPSTLQDDVAKIISQIKRYDSGDGFHPDDYAGSIVSATPLDVNGLAQTATGVIERMDDVDTFSFTAPGGRMDLAVMPPYPSALDAKLELYDSSGNLLAASDGTSNNAQRLDTDLASGIYYLSVSSHGSYGDLGSYEISARSLPAGWASADVGNVWLGGYSQFDSSTGTYTNAGSGGDVWGTADGGHFAYQPLTGNGTIIARVTQVAGTDPWAKVGLDIRESLAAGSKHAAMIMSYSNGAQFLYRGTTGGSTSGSNSSATAFSPIWLKLVRSGNTLTGYTSADGATWTQQGSATVSMASNVYIGLLTSSHNNNKLNVAAITDVSLTGNIGTPAPTYNSLPAPANVAVAPGTGTGLNVTWDPVAGATGYIVERSADNISFVQAGTTAAGTTSFADNGLWGSMRYFYRVSARDASGQGTPSDSAMAINRPNAVTNAAVTSWTDTSIVLNWRDVTGETGYRIERSTDGTTFTTLATLGVNVPSYTSTGLAAATPYYFRITPISALGDGPAVTITGSTRLAVVPNQRFTSIGATSISLAWNDIAGETNYKVQRSTDSSAFSNLVTNLAAGTTSYTNTPVTPLTENYYRVIGTNSATESVWGNPIFAASAAATALPAPWSSQDIGSVNGSGATGYSGGTFTIISSGGDIWGSADGFRYTYQPLVGNGEIVARVSGIENTGGWAKIGVMIRESLAANSRHVMVVDTPGNGIAMQYRSSTGGQSSHIAGPSASAPYWVRLVRSGSTFTGYASADGVSWTQVGSVTVGMGTSVYIGLSADANTTASLNTSTIDNVTVSNNAPTIATAAAASPANVAGTTTNLSVLGADDHGESNLTYTWSVTAKPAGAPDPVFSANGINAAKSTTATFGRAGAYTFTVTITDSGGLSVTSSVNVNVSQTLTTIAVSPAATTVAWGQKQQFTAIAYDQFAQTLASQPVFTWSVTGTGNAVAAGLVTAGARAGSYIVSAAASGITGTAALNVQSVVASRLVFYNNSARDGNDPAGNALDDSAIASDKQALVPGRTATFANYTSYARGINGIMIDLGGAASLALSAADFLFKIGNSSDPSSWAAAPAPTAVVIRAGAGAGSTDRIEILWADNAVQKQWLQVTVLGDANTGLGAPDVFYFGNAVGETGNDPANAVVDSADELLARANTTGLGTASISNAFDFNRDKRVNTQDQLIARANRSGLNPLRLIAAPVPGAPAPAPAVEQANVQTASVAPAVTPPIPPIMPTETIADTRPLFSDTMVGPAPLMEAMRRASARRLRALAELLGG